MYPRYLSTELKNCSETTIIVNFVTHLRMLISRDGRPCCFCCSICPYSRSCIVVGCADLGVFGKSVVDGQGDAGGDLALVGTFFVVVLVGTFASQVRREPVF